MSVALVEDLHRAAELVGAVDDDSSGLREYGFEEESVAEFVMRTRFFAGIPGVPEMVMDPVSLAYGIAVGMVARGRVGE